MAAIPTPRNSLSRLRRREAFDGFLFASPWLVGFVVFIFGPMIASLVLSTAQWDGITKNIHWVGLGNYRELITDDELFRKAMQNTLFYAGFSVPLATCTALGLALLLNQKVRGIAIFRTVFYLPAIVSGVATSMLWLWLFNPSYGLINHILRMVNHGFAFVGLDRVQIPEPGWLTNESTAIWAFILMSLWGVGNGMLIYLAGLQNMPEQLYEAADLDGASTAIKFRHVTLPMLTPTIFYNLIMAIIGSFQVFTASYVMTGGGPNNATLFYVLYLYKKAFEQFQMGYASAMAWILFAVVLALTLAVIKSSKAWVYYEGERAG